MERSEEDERAIAEAVSEVEKELGPKSNSSDFSILVVLMVLAAVVAYYLQLKK